MIRKLALSIILISITSFYGYRYFQNQAFEEKLQAKEFVRQSVSNMVTSESHFPQSIVYQDERIEIAYTIDEEFQKGLEELLKRYANENSAVVVLDNDSGKLLAVAGVNRSGREINYSLPFSSTHPSASLFKIVTTADLLKDEKLEPGSKISYSGRSTTLYKYQLKNKVNRWTRWVSLKKAFAQSNNVVFGKAAIQKSSAKSIFQIAHAFGFNRQLMVDFNLGPSRFLFPETPYELAEVASGFNKETMISPVHAALLSSIVANEGVMKSPYLINHFKFRDEKISFKKHTEEVLPRENIVDISSMMELTALKGTARGMTRGRLGRKLKDELVLGAKTGSITGGIPYGKREWLSLYAKRKTSKDKGISVSIMNINEKKWYYKSTFLAKKILELYLKNQKVAKQKVEKAAGV